jgi:sterol desaturase/sphingolipid hydroxylase (fatty acid hydroxylase superfamily)
MEQILKTINSLNGNYVLIILVALFYSLERILGTPFRFDKRVPHFLNNVVFQVFFYLANLAFVVVQVTILNSTVISQSGLFHYLDVPLWLKMILGVMCLDFTSYWFHRMAHRLPLLWRLHRVHHSDTTMDTSTFFRGHPFEVLVFGTGNTVACIIFGLDLSILGLYFIIVLPFLVAQHANIHLPAWTDRIFGRVFITPNLHKVHHEQNQYYTDSNFADIFIFWDKLFGTYKYLPVNQIRYGLKEFDSMDRQKFWYLMLSPFKRIPRNEDEKP